MVVMKNLFKTLFPVLAVAGVVAPLAVVATSCGKSKPQPQPQPTDSYYTLDTNPTKKIYFGESDTPITNFCGNYAGGFPDGYISIADQKLRIDDIHTLSFGSSYNDVTAVPSEFLNGEHNEFTDIVSLDLSGLHNATSFGIEFMNGWDGGFDSLTSLDLSMFTNVSSFGQCMLYANNGFKNLKKINIGSWQWNSNFSTDGFTSGLQNNEGEIIATNSSIGNGWLQGGLSNWSVSSEVTHHSGPELRALPPRGSEWNGANYELKNYGIDWPPHPFE